MLWTIRKATFRTHQRVMKLAAEVLPIPIPPVLGGPGSVRQLADNLSVRGLRHAFLVTDRGLMELGLPDPLLETLSARGIRCTVFDAVEPNPSIDTVEAGVRRYREHECDSIIGFGGGSPLDCAKLIGARAANPMIPLRRMKGLFKVVLPIPPLFAVPTTAGTGSETTVAAVVTDPETHEKFAVNDLKLVPKIAVLDPELMVGLPPAITAATGMDALTHAVEAYIGLNGTPFTDENAEQATRVVMRYLERAYEDGQDLEARSEMALASFRAGLAFTRTYVGYVHAIAHNMGGLYGVPHGLANAIVLPHVLRACRADAEAKLARLAVVSGLGAEGEPDEALSTRFIERVEELNRQMNIPTTIAPFRADDLELVVDRGLAEAHPDYPVPRIMTRDEFRGLVRQVLPA